MGFIYSLSCDFANSLVAMDAEDLQVALLGCCLEVIARGVGKCL